MIPLYSSKALGLFFRQPAERELFTVATSPIKIHKKAWYHSVDMRLQGQNIHFLETAKKVSKLRLSSISDANNAHSPSRINKLDPFKMNPHDFDRKNLQFEEARADQIMLLKSWLQKPHIFKYWGDGGLTIPDFIQFTSGQPSIFNHYFGYYLSEPIVFLMTSIAEEGGHLDKWREKEGTNLTLDIMIGDERFVGKGFGSHILQEFFEKKCQGVSAILIDPELEHTQAIRVYEKAGFKPQGTYVPKEGQWAGITHLILKKVLKKS